MDKGETALGKESYSNISNNVRVGVSPKSRSTISSGLPKFRDLFLSTLILALQALFDHAAVLILLV